MRNPRMFRPLLLCMCLLVGSSEMKTSSSDEVVSIRGDWRGRIRWVDFKMSQISKNEIMIFRSHSGVLVSKIEEKVNTSFGQKKIELVMVSASKYTALGQALTKHPSVVAIVPTPGSYYQNLVMSFKDTAERDEVARAVHSDIGACGGIIPISLTMTNKDPGQALPSRWSTAVKSSSIATVLDQVSKTNIQSSVAVMEALGTRDHAGANAATATATVKSSWTTVLPAGATISEYSHTNTSQKSVVVTIPGSAKDSETVIIGAHLDSINRSDETLAPGADDDATGIATITEVLRVIKAAGWKFDRRLEFHGYAGEEVGLLGSQEIASAYATAGRTIAGMLQMDMNGYATTANAGKIWLVSTNTSGQLRLQLKELLGNYLGGGFSEMALTAGTSDHRSWNYAGYHAVFPFEHPQDYNHLLHTTGDKSSVLDFGLSARFAKLALAWLAHNAGIQGVDIEFKTAGTSLSATETQIKLAIVGSTSGSYRIGIAAPITAATASSCILQTSADGGCAEEPVAFSVDHQTTDKTFFMSGTDISMTANAVHRVTIYDSNGAVIAQRIVKAKQK